MQLVGFLVEGLTRRGVAEFWVDLGLFPSREKAETAATTIRCNQDRIIETRVCRYLRGKSRDPRGPETA